MRKHRAFVVLVREAMPWGLRPISVAVVRDPGLGPPRTLSIRGVRAPLDDLRGRATYMTVALQPPILA